MASDSVAIRRRPGTAGSPIRAAAGSLALALAGCLAGCEEYAPPPAPPSSQSSSRPAAESGGAYSDDYIAALTVAHEFCRAWRRSDLSAGTALLSTRARRTYTDARIRDVLVATDNPRHAAFELSAGRRTEPGTFVFRVRLFLRFAGQANDRIEAPLEQLAVRREADGAWRVDRFPMLDGPE